MYEGIHIIHLCIAYTDMSLYNEVSVLQNCFALLLPVQYKALLIAVRGEAAIGQSAESAADWQPPVYPLTISMSMGCFYAIINENN